MRRFAEAEELLRLAIVAGKAWEGFFQADDQVEETVTVTETAQEFPRGFGAGGVERRSGGRERGQAGGLAELPPTKKTAEHEYEDVAAGTGREEEEEAEEEEEEAEEEEEEEKDREECEEEGEEGKEREEEEGEEEGEEEEADEEEEEEEEEEKEEERQEWEWNCGGQANDISKRLL